jgi:gamma-glutamyltranspeptidase / glutathione hydrolase
MLPRFPRASPPDSFRAARGALGRERPPRFARFAAVASFAALALGPGLSHTSLPLSSGTSLMAQQSPVFPGRSAVYAPRGMVATSQPLATSAGLRVLEEGGNAVDAAVTAAAVLTVVEPHMTGIGGDLFALLWPANEGRVVGLSAHGRSGSLMTREALLEAGHESIPTRGPESITVPGALRGWADLLERYGTRTLGQALEPAIRLAEEGFPVSPIIARDWAEEVEMLQRNEGARATYLVDGERAPASGEWFRNPDYARTLRQIASEGPDALYGGPLGARVAEGVRALGGFLTLEDLRDHRSRWVEPISAPFRDVRLWEIPPPGQGIAALQMLRILEPFPLEAMGHNSPEYLHHLVEAKKLAYADLAAHVADPRFMEVEARSLLSDGYLDGRRGELDPWQAMETTEPGAAATESETIYLTVADGEGNMISLINSVYFAFGSGVVVPGTGFDLQNRGSGFTLEPGLPNSVAPGKEPFHTIIPAFVTRTGPEGREEPWISFGVMGGAMQPQGHVQVLLNVLLFGMDPQTAVEAPRFRHYSGLRLGLEAGIGEGTRAALRARGHDVFTAGPGAVGGAQLILRLEGGGWGAGSDPRKDGHAAGH